MKVRILHCITGLTRDGAQRMLHRLVRGMDAGRFENRVVSLCSEEPFADEFRSAGIPVDCLGTKGVAAPLTPLRLWRVVREFRPSIVQGWMYHGNLVASLAAALAPGRPTVVWNVRNCLADRAGAKRLTDLVIRVNATFSAAPAAIIYCAQAAMEQHTRLGFSRDHGVVIGNGYDFSVFAPSAERAREFRRELGVGETTRIVGTIGRFHPWKNHPLFLSVASGVAARFSEVVFVMIGRGVDLANVALTEQIRELGLEGRVFLLGERGDVPKLLPAFDLYCSTSTNEGFPNVIAEAMAAGAPGVVTDVGASRELVEGIGAVVPSGDREGIVAGLCDLLSLPEGEFAERRKAARERMISRHSLPQVVERYQWLYTSLVAPVA